MLSRFYDYYINFLLKCHKKPAQIKTIEEWSHPPIHVFFFLVFLFGCDDEAGKCARHDLGAGENLAGKTECYPHVSPRANIQIRLDGPGFLNILSC